MSQGLLSTLTGHQGTEGSLQEAHVAVHVCHAIHGRHWGQAEIIHLKHTACRQGPRPQLVLLPFRQLAKAAAVRMSGQFSSV